MRKILSFIMMLVITASVVAPTSGVSAEALSDDIAILYTNDVHTYIDGPLSYDVIAAIKEDLQNDYKYVILADAGDHIQGTAYGSMDKGESIIRLMNAAGYDVATLGNHEFDYNMQGCMNAIALAEYKYISCNFYRESNGVRGENVLDGYTVFDCGDEKVAFVGITTPETFSKSTPAYFQDENGNFIYGISGGDNGSELQEDIQKAIDGAKTEGATRVIALGHLGVDPSSKPWTSEETIAGVSGLDAFIDGHSHTVIEGEKIKDKDGRDVVLTQTGEYFNRIGIMVIDSDSSEIATDFIEIEEIISGDGETVDGYKLSSDIYTGTEFIFDAEVKEIKDEWIHQIDLELGQKIGSAEVIFDNYDENGNRLVRLQETNSGDFAADALYYLFDDMGLDVDVAIMNGGGVRNAAITGDITYKICKDIHPFGNVACLQTVTGQQILDMLEWGSRHAGASEDGSFLHVSGITYKINYSIPDTTQADDMDVWVGGPSEYRVHDVKMYNKDTDNWDDLDLDAEYNLAGYNYTLRDLGGGFAMLNGAVNVLDYVMEDYMVLANYIKAFDGSVIEADNSPLNEKYSNLMINYSDVNGDGRITVHNGSENDASDFGVWVGGVPVTEDNMSDMFGDGTVSYDPETNTITLNGYSYEGDGYYYFSYYDEENDCTELYTAVIYSETSITVKLEGNNSIKNTYTDPDEKHYGDGVIAEDNITIIGDGCLDIYGVYAIECADTIIIDGSNLNLNSIDIGIISDDVFVKNNAQVSISTDVDGIVADEGNVTVENGASVVISAIRDGIYAYRDVVITDSTVDIKAEGDGIYSYDGNVIIGSTDVKLSKYGSWLEGTKVSIEAGRKYGIFAYNGLTIDGKLTITTPENGKIGEIAVDNDEYEDYVYSTVISGEAAAKNIVIEPLGYHVSIEGLSYSMAALVPVGQSLNDVYCAMYGVEDFSEILDTEKEGYVFDGWYTDETCTAEYDFNSSVISDITIYPKWISVTDDTGNEDNVTSDVPDNNNDPSDAPQTGDNTVIWVMLVMASAIGTCLCKKWYEAEDLGEDAK